MGIRSTVLLLLLLPYKVQKCFSSAVISLIIREITEADAAHLSFVKNSERKTLSPMEEARHILRMKEEFGFTNEELEVKGYGSPAKITLVLKLLGLAKPVQARIDNGELTKEHGIHLSALPTAKEQERMSKRVIDFNWTAVRTKEKVKRYLNKDKKARRKPPESIIPAGEVPGVYFKDACDMRGEFPSESVHAIFTSPPYLIGQEYEKGVSLKEHIANVSAVMGECARVLVPGGVLALNLGDIHNYRGEKGRDVKPDYTMMGHRYQSWLKRGKVRLCNIIIWRKRVAWGKESAPVFNDDTEHTTYRFFANWEPIYIFRKEGVRSIPEAEDIVMRSRITREQFRKWSDGVWDIEPAHPMKGHPAIWPDRLTTRLIRMFSYEGDTVLDPFLGSGCTVKVARELGREGIGYERLPQYKEVIMRTLGIEETAAPAETMVEYAGQSAGTMDREAEKASAEVAAFDRMMEDHSEATESTPAV